VMMLCGSERRRGKTCSSRQSDCGCKCALHESSSSHDSLSFLKCIDAT
jgi:hypothetical protein